MRTIQVGERNYTHMYAALVDDGFGPQLIKIRQSGLRHAHDIGPTFRIEHDAGVYGGTLEEWDNSILRRALAVLQGEEVAK